MDEKSIQLTLLDYFKDEPYFTLKEAEEVVKNIKEDKVKIPSIRARLYEAIDRGELKRISRGVYTYHTSNNTCLIINGNGRNLSMIKDNSIDAIITDHPYQLTKSHKGGNRNLANYDTFKYDENDFKEKYRVLKKGGFLVEFIPEENGDNWEYLTTIKQLAKDNGLIYYSKVPWKKGGKPKNTGRKSKDTEEILFFSKGKARTLRLDTKKNKNEALKNGLDIKGLNSYELATLLQTNNLNVYYMSGTKNMLPTEFYYQQKVDNEKIHTAEKPVELYEAIIEQVSCPDEILLDQFSGSFNMAIASMNKQRNVLAFELNEKTLNTGRKNIEESLDVISELEVELEH